MHDLGRYMANSLFK